MSDGKGNSFVLMVLTLVGGIIFTIGAWIMISRIQFMSTAQRVEGEITSFKSHRSRSHSHRGPRRSRKKFRSIVSYTVDGKTHKLTSEKSSSFAPPVGQHVDVVYDREEPNRAYIAKELWYMPGFLSLIGGIFTAAGIYSLLRRRASPSQGQPPR